MKNNIWTWCPRCTVRTDHERVGLYFRCAQCGCLHTGAIIINHAEETRDRAGRRHQGGYHGF